MTASTKAAIATCGAIVLALALFPGDAPWGGDDVTFIARAMEFNHAHRLIDVGPEGNFNFFYGPLAGQFYQVLTAITHNPLLLIRLHAILLSGITAAALLWLTGSLRWSPWLAALGMLSPFFWFYSRLLWDNSLAIPIGAMLAASYASYIRRPSRGPFLTAMACVLMLPLIHPMTLPLSGAVMAHWLPRRRVALRRWPLGIGIVLFCAAISGGRYVVQCADRRQHVDIYPRVGYQRIRMTHVQAATFGLRAGWLFSARAFQQGNPGQEWPVAGDVWGPIEWVSALAYPLAWIGIAYGLMRLRRGWGGDDAGDAIAAIAVATLLLQGLMYAIMRVASYPHYLCGTWIACWVCMCMGVRWLGRGGVAIAAVYAVSVMTATVLMAVQVHRDAGGPEPLGLSIGAQLNVAEELSAFRDRLAVTDSPPLLAVHFRSVAVLRQMLGRTPERYSRGHLFIEAVRPGTGDMRLKVVEQRGPLPDDVRRQIITGAEP